MKSEYYLSFKVPKWLKVLGVKRYAIVLQIPKWVSNLIYDNTNK